MPSNVNIDPNEIDKFQAIASRWWDKESEFKPLHEINPLRLAYIETHAGSLKGKKILDIGCGGGILSEALAEKGALVTGIDMADQSLRVAKMHLHESKLEVDYQLSTAEDFALAHKAEFDLITCMEMLEHVPHPEQIVSAASQMLKPDGRLFLSTINRNPKSFLMAIVGAEYLLKMIPRGTHEYRKLIKPSELAKAARACGLDVNDVSGMTYNPLSRQYKIGRDIDVNYLMSCLNSVGS
ncbi:MAG: 2-polyprenyl-6-hydroxyphenyl methylase/3-demethylubiquinone-9 3-methyltransferase [Planctomycetota bacterium]|jgi:2-polyprenyl-6-hydroxyphenyl methylase/3-demethylubiquinone-9 3-methyltransferase